jgi:feruloyl esterase
MSQIYLLPPRFEIISLTIANHICKLVDPPYITNTFGEAGIPAFWYEWILATFFATLDAIQERIQPMIYRLAILLFVVNASAATPCEGLKTLLFSNASITTAELRPAGLFNADSKAPGPPQPALTLPAYCRIAAVLTPSPDSHIEMELWLPAETAWNGKFQAVGNGGWAGTISYSAMAQALREGYATASNDTGHKEGNALFGIGHPEKVTDYAYRAVHEMTVQSKAMILAFYGSKPKLSYWNGCSTGGRQGLMAAQRYPEDFDGIVAGAPANYHSHLHGSDMVLAVPVMKDPTRRVSPAKLKLLNSAVLAACDELDGVKDGLLQNPQQCHYDPSALLCKGEDAETCLTGPQVETVKRMYAPVAMTTGEVIFPGKSYGSELGWSLNSDRPSPVSVGTFQLTYQDAQWDWRSFDTDRDIRLADQKTGFINAIDPNLKAFKDRGGKLLLYHGWDDMGIAPGNTVNYYNSVLSKLGSKQEDWLRLFMVPGMGHCSGGNGPNQAGFFEAMESWRESNAAPAEITAYHVTGNRVDRSRPLCPFPQIARYKGTGSINDAANFECKNP